MQLPKKKCTHLWRHGLRWLSSRPAVEARMLFLGYVCEFACSASTVPPRAAGPRASCLREQTKRPNDDAPSYMPCPREKKKPPNIGGFSTL